MRNRTGKQRRNAIRRAATAVCEAIEQRLLVAGSVAPDGSQFYFLGSALGGSGIDAITMEQNALAASDAEPSPASLNASDSPPTTETNDNGNQASTSDGPPASDDTATDTTPDQLTRELLHLDEQGLPIEEASDVAMTLQASSGSSASPATASDSNASGYSPPSGAELLFDTQTTTAYFPSSAADTIDLGAVAMTSPAEPNGITVASAPELNVGQESAPMSMLSSNSFSTNGTVAPEVALVADINTDVEDSDPGNLVNVNGTLFFTADDGTVGVELWKIEEGDDPVLVTDICLGIGSSSPHDLVNVGGTLYFAADDGVSGVELWKVDTNGTAVRVADINPLGGSSSPSELTDANGLLYFGATDAGGSTGLWRSDGTGPGTTKVKSVSPQGLVCSNGMLFFGGLWRSDGTETGTVLVKGFPYGIQSLVDVNGTPYFTALDLYSGQELWKSDGTTAGTVRVKDIRPGTGSSFAQLLTNVNGRLFFRAMATFSPDLELWKSDGTATGTVRVKDIYPGSGNESRPLWLTGLGDTLYFTAMDGTRGRELWRSDGTDAGTVLVKDIWPGNSDSNPENLAGANGLLYFAATDAGGGTELWQSDGTAAGTLRLADINIGEGSSSPQDFIDVNGLVYFSADDGVHGRELWVVRPGDIPAVEATPTTGGDSLAGTPGGVAFGADGGNPMSLAYSGGAVRYADGREFYTASDIAPAEPGLLSGLTRTWSSDPGRNFAEGIGSGWCMSQWPVLTQSGTSIKAIDGGTSIRWFDWNGSAYTARFFSQDKLEQVGDDFKLTDTTGNVTEYYGFGNPTLSLRGMPKRFVDAGGNEAVFTYVSGQLTKIERKLGSGTVLEETGYVWNDELLQSATIKRRDSVGLQVVRSAHYTYSTGELTHVAIKDDTGTTIDQSQYWYTNGRLTTVLEGDSYQRAVGASIDPTAANAEQVAPYADLVFGYDDAAGLLGYQTMQGLGTYQYHYSTPSSFTDGINNWKYKTTEYLPDDTPADLTDNDRRIVYSNYAGEVLASIFQDYDGTTLVGQWGTAYQYDSAGRLTLEAAPSAVDLANLSEANAELVAPMLRTDAGLFFRSEYYTSGSAMGYLQYEAVTQGTGGTTDKTSEYVYDQQRPNSQGRLVTSETIYSEEGSTGGAATTYAYTFQSDAVAQRTTTLPAVSTAQNGADSATSIVEQFDSFGRLTSLTDGDGKSHTFDYVQSTGALALEEIDAGTGGLAIETLYVSDLLGRTTQITDPMGLTTTITYNDTEQYSEVRTQYPAVSGGEQVPDDIVRYGRQTGIVDTLTVMRGTNMVLSLSQAFYNNLGQRTAEERYDYTVNVTYSQASGSGGAGSRYRTEYHYDIQGRQDGVTAGRDYYVDSMGNTNPTITRTAYDALGRVVETWIGTDDTSWSPANPGTNMVKVSENEYDGGGIGDGNLTKVTLFPGDGSPDRVTVNLYDWRNRLVSTKSGVQTTEDEAVNRPLTVYAYDNLGQQTAVSTYDGDAVTMADADADGIPDSLPSAARRALGELFYDDRGRTYRSMQHSINQITGADEGALATDTWYNNRDQVIKSEAPGGLVTKVEYDGAGRVTKQSITDGDGDIGWADAASISDDTVLEQTLSTYDSDGNAILTVTKQRDHDATTTGDLTYTDSRISVVASWYDEANRPIVTVDYGNNGDDAQAFLSGGVYVRPGSAPARANADGWDPWLRTDYAYGTLGLVEDVIDPRGIVTKTTYDGLGRRRYMVEAYVQGSTDVDTNRMTQWAYNGFDQVKQQATHSYEVVNGALQTRAFITDYTYGVDKGADDGHALNDSGLLRSVSYHRSNEPEITSELVTKYNALGEVVRNAQDNPGGQDVRTHIYTYDVVGRKVSDEKIGLMPTTMYQGVWRLRYEYDALDRIVKATSDDNETDVANQVEREYDGLGHLVTEWQDHDDEVQKTGADVTPKVSYSYDTSFVDNRSRLSTTTYPNGRILWVGYDNTALNDAISRPGYLADSDLGDPTQISLNHLEAYEYLGYGTIVSREQRVEWGPFAKDPHWLKYYDIPSDELLDPDGSGPVNPDDAGSNDQYNGLDRFGRVLYQNWSDGYGTGSSFHYAYDAVGNPLYAYSLMGGFTELYQDSQDLGSTGSLSTAGYDRLGRLLHWSRGNFTFDGDDSVDGFIGSRSQNWEVSAATGGHYERTGMPQPADPQQRLTWQGDVRAGVFTRGTGVDVESPADRNSLFARTDLFVRFDAWGRLSIKTTATLRHADPADEDTNPYYTYDATYEDPDSPRDEQTYAYDALGRRIRTSWVMTSATTSRGAIGSRDYYLDSAGNTIQENNDGGGALNQFVWSLAGTRLLVVQDIGGEAGIYGLTPNWTGMSFRLWTAQGPDGSVWATQDDWGDYPSTTLYRYTPEGQVATFDAVGSAMADYEAVSPHLWRGYWAEVFAQKVSYTQFRDAPDGLYWTGAQEHDSWRGGPLQEDVSAYVASDGHYNEWTPTALNYPHDGTGGFWNSIASLGQTGGMWNVWWNPSAHDMSTVSTPTADAMAKVSGWVGVAALTAASGGTYGLALLAGGAMAGAASGAVYSAYSGADYWRSVEIGANVGAIAGGFPGAARWAGAKFMQYGDEIGAGFVSLAGRFGGGSPAAALIGGGSRALAIGGESAALLGAGAPVNWGGLAGWGVNAAFSVIRGPLSAEGRRYAGISNTSPYRAGVSRTPRHHWLPQRDQAFFKAREITKAEMDRLTTPITEGFHQAIEKYVGPLGGYRNTLMQNILSKEAQYERLLTRREVLREAARLRRAAGLQDAKVISYGAP